VKITFLDVVAENPSPRAGPSQSWGRLLAARRFAFVCVVTLALVAGSPQQVFDVEL